MTPDQEKIAQQVIDLAQKPEEEILTELGKAAAAEEQQPKEDLIKVRLQGETVWAVRLTPTTAEIRNTPLDERVNFKDIVEIDGHHNFIKVIERYFEQAGIEYEYDPETIKVEYPKMAQYLRDHEVFIEGYTAGFAGVDFKKGRDHEEIKKILDNSPMKITNVEFK